MNEYPMPLLERLPAEYLLNRVADLLLLGEGESRTCVDCGREFRSAKLDYCGGCALDRYAVTRNQRRSERKNAKLGRHVCCDCRSIDIPRHHQRCSTCAAIHDKAYQQAYRLQRRRARAA